MSYEVNYDDERFTEVETEKQEALTETEKLYGGMVSESDNYYQAQIDATKDYAETQKQNQQEQTDFAIEKVEQQKEQAHKDYLKEQTGAYVDWQKQGNQYGANAEKMAAQGLAGTGYSESSQVSMYNTYQNRVASARESYTLAVLNYDNAIKDAILQNNAALAEIAYTALQQQLELSLQGFQYKNNLLLEQASKKLEINTMYYNRWKDVLNQINTENELAEKVRQYDETMAEEKRQYDETMAENKRQFDETMAYNKSKSSSSSSSSSSSDTGDSGTITGSLDETSYEVSTPYYQGKKNADVAEYGAFSNGYQPKGISGHGKLSKTQDTAEFTTEVKYGENAGKTETVKQTVWKAEDGTLWYWEGRENKYKPFSKRGGGGGKF